MRTLLLGLVLAAPALATPLENCLFCFAGMDFSNYVHPITVENTPEWAQVPNARAWYEFELGILRGRWEGMMLVLRGLVFLEDRPRLQSWLDIVPVDEAGSEGPLAGSDTPEPAAWLLVTVGACVISLRRGRNRAGGGDAGRRSSWWT